MDELSKKMQPALHRDKEASSESKELKFTLDPHNSNRAIGSDHNTFIMLKYEASPQENYIKFFKGEKVQNFHFENHHNKACSIYISSGQELYPNTISDLKQALEVIGFTANIEFNYI